MKLSQMIFAPALLGLALAAPAAAQDQEALKAKYQDKLAKEFISHGGWITDWDVARKKAKAEGKQIFAYFSRSYAP